MASKFSHSMAVGAAAVGVGVVVGAGLAYLSTRVLYTTRVAQEISHLHENIVEMKRNLAVIEKEIERLHGVPSQASIMNRLNESSCRNILPEEERNGIISVSNFSDVCTPSRPSIKVRKNVSFSNSVAHSSPAVSNEGCSYATAVDDRHSLSSTSFVTALSDTASNSAYDTDYFSPDEGESEDDQFFDIVCSDAEETETVGPSWNASGVAASALTKLLRKVDSLFSNGSEGDVVSAHHHLLQAEVNYPDNAEILWRLAKSFRNLSTLEDKKGNLEMKKENIFTAYLYAERSLAINSNSPHTHKWFAITAGARGEFLSTRDRIESGRLFKKHIDTALSFSPNDSTLHHLLGRFCYEVSGLTWLERKAATALFGAVPESTYSEALEHFKSAEALHEGGWKENKLYIAKCLIQLNCLYDVHDWLKSAKQLPNITSDDVLVNRELEQLLQKYPA